jgi:hypothetical protein
MEVRLVVTALGSGKLVTDLDSRYNVDELYDTLKSRGRKELLNTEDTRKCIVVHGLNGNVTEFNLGHPSWNEQKGVSERV